MACSAEKANFRGWEAVYLRNGLVTLAAVPDIGGRIMAYDLGTYPYLFVDPDLAGMLFSPEENQGDGSLSAWKNYGGDKTWPSPQGWDSDEEWHGPPDPVLDSGRYTLKRFAASSEEAVVEMASPPDPRTGIQITRKATLHNGGSRVTLDLSFTNMSSHVVRWSIWDVLQLRAERLIPEGGLAPETACTVSAPLNPFSRFPRGFQVMFGAEDNPQWGTDLERGLFIARYAWEIGKVGIDSPGGWVAFSNGASGHAFTERFTFIPGADYPDQGATVECWTVGRGRVANLDYECSSIYLMETEVLSPFYTFQPGQSHSMRIEWGACRCPGLVVQVTAAGCTATPLKAGLADSQVHLSGSFGVFDVGELRLAWLGQGGAVLQVVPLGAATPLQMVLLEGVYDLPEGAGAVELQVAAAGGGAVHRLDGITFEESR